MVEEMYRDFRKHKDEDSSVLNKERKQTNLILMTTQREREKKKAFLHLLVALCIIRNHP